MPDVSDASAVLGPGDVPDEARVLPRAMLRMVVDQYRFMVAWLEEQAVPEEYVGAARAQLVEAEQYLADWRRSE